MHLSCPHLLPFNTILLSHRTSMFQESEKTSFLLLKSWGDIPQFAPPPPRKIPYVVHIGETYSIDIPPGTSLQAPLWWVCLFKHLKVFDSTDVCAEARYIINAMHGASEIKGREREKLSPTGHRFKVCLRERNLCEENGGERQIILDERCSCAKRIYSIYSQRLLIITRWLFAQWCQVA